MSEPTPRSWEVFFRGLAQGRSAAGDAEALAVLDQLAQESETHRRHSDCYAYEFFVARRSIRGTQP